MDGRENLERTQRGVKLHDLCRMCRSGQSLAPQTLWKNCISQGTGGYQSCQGGKDNHVDIYKRKSELNIVHGNTVAPAQLTHTSYRCMPAGYTVCRT